MPIDKQKILAGRKAVQAYRTAHTKLYEKGQRKGIPEEHTPLLNIMLRAFKDLGFNTIREFFDANNVFIKEELAKVYQIVGECNHCGKCCGGCRDYEGGGICRIYETRPQGCRDYPTIQDLLTGVPEECSYSLKKIAEPDIDVRWH